MKKQKQDTPTQAVIRDHFLNMPFMGGQGLNYPLLGELTEAVIADNLEIVHRRLEGLESELNGMKRQRDELAAVIAGAQNFFRAVLPPELFQGSNSPSAPRFGSGWLHRLASRP